MSAESALADMTVANARKPARFFQSLRRATREGYKALGMKDYEGFANGKRKELFSLHMFRQSMDFKTEFDKALRRFGKINKKPKGGKFAIDPEYHEMAWKVLANFKAGPAGVAPINIKDFRNWINNIDKVQNPSETTINSILITPDCSYAHSGRRSYFLHSSQRAQPTLS